MDILRKQEKSCTSTYGLSASARSSVICSTTGNADVLGLLISIAALLLCLGSDPVAGDGLRAPQHPKFRCSKRDGCPFLRPCFWLSEKAVWAQVDVFNPVIGGYDKLAIAYGYHVVKEAPVWGRYRQDLCHESHQETWPYIAPELEERQAGMRHTLQVSLGCWSHLCLVCRFERYSIRMLQMSRGR